MAASGVGLRAEWKEEKEKVWGLPAEEVIGQ
jgi:hypothetical protein